MNASRRIKSLIPSRLRQIVQPSWVRNYRWWKRFRREHPDVEIIQPADVHDCTFGRYVRIDKHAWVYKCVLGDHTYVADAGIVACCDIGKFCSIASRSHVGLAQHPSRDFVSTHPAFYRADPSAYLLYADRDYFPGFVRTLIGNDVWIGSAAQVRGGVTIGNGAILGAGAVVTANVEPYSVMVGVPARHMRFRFDPDTIAFLERFRWWDRDETWLAANYKKFHDIDAFRAEFEKQVQ